MCFTVQLSKIGFALPFVSNNFTIISCCFLPVKNFFQLFWSCFCFSLAATLISYHIQPAVVKNFFISFLQLFVRRNSFMLSRVFSDVKNFFSFLSINAEGGIWTLARRKPSIPLAGAPLQPLEYFCTSLITQWAKSIILKHFTFVNGIFYISSNSLIVSSIRCFTIAAISVVFIPWYFSYGIGSRKCTCTVSFLIEFVSKDLYESIRATGTMGHWALTALLKLPPLKSRSWFPFRLLVPSAKIR